MAHVHDHGSEDLGALPEVRRRLRIVTAVFAAVTVVGLVVWWPDSGASLPSGFDGQGTRVDATVTDVRPTECAGAEFGVAETCDEVVFDVTSGANAGSEGSFELYPQSQVDVPEVGVGDRLVVIEYELGGTGELAYTFADFQRRTPLIWLGVLFVVAVLALGRLQGVRALLGLVVSGAVLFAYVFPALLEGKPPLPVALVAASVIAFAALYLAHGVSDTTTVALLGTLGALVLTGILAAVFTAAAQISGLASEDQIYLLVSAEGIDLQGLVLAGIILGTLGVLDDVTVTQVSAVARLREANPRYTARDLYTNGVRIGRDHIASTVNTLVLAYAGASLPLLLFYSNIGIGFSEAVTSEIVAVEIIRTLVGSIGLVASVPLTTALAALVVTAGPGVPVVTGRRLRQPGRDGAGAGATGEGEGEVGERGGAVPGDGAGEPSWDDFGPTGERF